MCSGLRDAANLAWKLAAVTSGNADGRLLDTYQPEREPNVRATIAMAIMMGRMVCTTSKWSALLRDMKFKLGRLLGKLPAGPPAYPPISEGLIAAGSAAAGSYFPQAIAANGARLDACLGRDYWLLSRADMAGQSIAPYAAQLEAWFDKTGTEAVLVRPDHYVFGTGHPETLKQSWDRAVSDDSDGG